MATVELGEPFYSPEEFVLLRKNRRKLDARRIPKWLWDFDEKGIPKDERRSRRLVAEQLSREGVVLPPPEEE
jgi:hypothetical protein